MNNDLIREFSLSYPSQISRYIMERELKQANARLNILKWKPNDGMIYLRELESKGLNPSSIKTKVLRLSKFYSWLIENGHYKGINPIPVKSIPKFRESRTPQALTHAETVKLLKSVPSATWIGCRDRFALALMLIHGLRIGTVCNMEWDHIEKSGRDWIIKTKGKGGVYSSRILRPDVADLMKKFYFKTFRQELK